MKKLLLTLLATLLIAGAAYGSELSVILAAIDAVDNFVDTEIGTIDTEVGVIDDSLNFAITGRTLSHALVDGRLGLPFVTQCTSVDAGVAPWGEGIDYAVFAVAGAALVKIVGVVVGAVTEGNGDETVSLGTTGIAGNLMAAEATPATDWGAVGAPVIGTGSNFFVLQDTEVDVQVLGTTGISDGVLRFYAIWYPLTASAAVDSTAWN